MPPDQTEVRAGTLMPKASVAPSSPRVSEAGPHLNSGPQSVLVLEDSVSYPRLGMQPSLNAHRPGACEMLDE